MEVPCAKAGEAESRIGMMMMVSQNGRLFILRGVSIFCLKTVSLAYVTERCQIIKQQRVSIVAQARFQIALGDDETVVRCQRCQRVKTQGTCVKRVV